MRALLIVVASLAVAGCKKEATPSKPVSCAVAGDMVAKRMREFAVQANWPSDKQAAVDKAMSLAIAKQCVLDLWDEVPLGCLGAIASVPDLDTVNYNKGVEVCTEAIGEAKMKNMSAAAIAAAKTVLQPAEPTPAAATPTTPAAPTTPTTTTPTPTAEAPKSPAKTPATRVKRPAGKAEGAAEDSGF